MNRIEIYYHELLPYNSIRYGSYFNRIQPYSIFDSDDGSGLPTTWEYVTLDTEEFINAYYNRKSLGDYIKLYTNITPNMEFINNIPYSRIEKIDIRQSHSTTHLYNKLHVYIKPYLWKDVLKKFNGLTNKDYMNINATYKNNEIIYTAIFRPTNIDSSLYKSDPDFKITSNGLGAYFFKSSILKDIQKKCVDSYNYHHSIDKGIR